MGDAIFRADLIITLESELGFGAAAEAAEIMLRDATDAQIDEVRDLLPENLHAVLSSRQALVSH